MRILFCNIAWMDYYKGIISGKDIPQNGGSYVAENGYGNEVYNFEAIPLSEEQGYTAGEYCLGFVETKTTNGQDRNQLKIESIDGCKGFKNCESVDNVLVVYCARYPDSAVQETYVVGWYKNATVYRRYQEMDFPDTEGGIYCQEYNAIAKKEDCVLLPRPMRRRSNLWKVPRRSSGVSYGFGQSNVWFANGRTENTYLDAFLTKMVKQIKEYDGENWIEIYPD